MYDKIKVLKKQCCGARAGAGGAEIIWDLEPEPKLNFQLTFSAVSLEDATMKISSFLPL